MDGETLFDVLFGAGLVALFALNVARWGAERARSRAAGWLFAVQALVALALAVLVLLRYFDVWPEARGANDRITSISRGS